VYIWVEECAAQAFLSLADMIAGIIVLAKSLHENTSRSDPCQKIYLLVTYCRFQHECM